MCPETPAEVRHALTSALAGGPAVAPLPVDPREREQALGVLRPDLPLFEPDVAAVVTTSGSTGRPKGVVLSRSAVTAAAHAAHERLGGPGSWILALPPHYVAGLMVLARAEVAGTDVAVADPGLLDLEQAAATLSGRRYLSLVPTQLLRACDDPRTGRILARLDGVLVGGSAVDPALLDRARALGVPGGDQLRDERDVRWMCVRRGAAVRRVGRAGCGRTDQPRRARGLLRVPAGPRADRGQLERAHLPHLRPRPVGRRATPGGWPPRRCRDQWRPQHRPRRTGRPGSSGRPTARSR